MVVLGYFFLGIGISNKNEKQFSSFHLENEVKPSTSAKDRPLGMGENHPPGCEWQVQRASGLTASHLSLLKSALATHWLPGWS